MMNLKKLLTINILFTLAISVSVSAWAFDETHLKKFKALNKCENCDLSEVNLSEANLRRAELNGANLKGANLIEANLKGVDLSEATLKGAKLDDAILCKTKMPWGEENSGCE